MFYTAGTQELENPEKGVHASLAEIQEKTAVLPDYAFKADASETASEEAQPWPVVDAGTSVSGLVGGALTLFLAVAVGLLLKRRKSAA